MCRLHDGCCVTEMDDGTTVQMGERLSAAIEKQASDEVERLTADDFVADDSA